MKGGNIDIKEDHSLVKVNTKIYPMDIVYSAAYVILDEAYVVLDGDPEKEVFAEIRAKPGYDLEEISNKFNEELINYAVFKSNSEKNKKVKEMILQRALITNGFSGKEDEEESLDDPDGIAVPWEEKYGKDNDS